MRLDRPAPRGPVVAAARRVEVHRISLRGECVRHRGIVRVVLLVERAGDGRRHGAPRVAAGEHGADEAVDTGEATEAGLLPVGAAPEEAAGLEKERGERPRLEPLRVEERKAAEARTEAD